MVAYNGWIEVTVGPRLAESRGYGLVRVGQDEEARETEGRIWADSGDSGPGFCSSGVA